jgi:hypothetical protein
MQASKQHLAQAIQRSSKTALVALQQLRNAKATEATSARQQ